MLSVTGGSCSSVSALRSSRKRLTSELCGPIFKPFDLLSTTLNNTEGPERFGCCGSMIDPARDLVDAIIMAQVSMTALKSCLQNTKIPVYNDGRTAFNAVREILESRS